MFKSGVPKVKNMPEERFDAKSFWFRTMVRVLNWLPWFSVARTISHLPFYKTTLRGSICYVMQEDLFFKLDKTGGVWWAVGKKFQAQKINDWIVRVRDNKYAPEPVIPMNADFTKVKFDAPREDF